MDLNDTLKQFEAVEANLSKLERIWKEIKELLPSDNALSVADIGKYLQLKRNYDHIAAIMPKIDGVALGGEVLHPDDIARNKVDSMEANDFHSSLAFASELYAPDDALNDYRFRLDLKRRELARQAVQNFITKIDTLLAALKTSTRGRKDTASMPKHEWQELNLVFKSIDALLGSLPRPERWNDMGRHLHFGSKMDYRDIVEHDWPKIRLGLERSLYAETEPLPISAADLGELVSKNPHGAISTELHWKNLSPADFERLMFNLIDRPPEYQNPQWLTHTTAPDRGRDLSVERIAQDSLSGTRRIRIILACKHTGSVNLKVVAELKEQMKLWEPPKVDELIIATTGRFTTDAVDYVEKHNQGSNSLRLVMWPSSHLERIIASRPDLIAEFRLRS